MDEEERFERWLEADRSPGAPMVLVVEEAAALVTVMLDRGPMSWPTTERFLRVLHETLTQHRAEVDLNRATIDLMTIKRQRVAECGTPSGYQRHWRNKEPACAPCQAAASEARKRYSSKP